MRRTASIASIAEEMFLAQKDVKYYVSNLLAPDGDEPTQRGGGHDPLGGHAFGSAGTGRSSNQVHWLGLSFGLPSRVGAGGSVADPHSGPKSKLNRHWTLFA